jgi:fused signal recognition particle receptor
VIGSFKKWVAEVRGGAIDWDELEAALIQSDLGLDLSSSILDQLQGQPLSAETVEEAARQRLKGLWPEPIRPLQPGTVDQPAAWLILGVNGSGKTTTIAKLARKFHQAEQPVHLVAADTFRAAAIEQLQIWSDTLGTGFTAGKEGGDPAAAAYEGIHQALQQHAATILIDTAGRLHNNDNLMRELEKVKRVIGKFESQPRECLLVLDGTNGSNAIEQARKFHQALDVTGIIATKLEGSSKGGALAAIKEETGLDPLYLGTGESPDDLIPFDPDQYVHDFF